MWDSARKIRNNQLQNSHNLRTSAAATIISPLVSKNSLCSLNKTNDDLTITKLVNEYISSNPNSNNMQSQYRNGTAKVCQKTFPITNVQQEKLITNLNPLKTPNSSSQNSATLKKNSVTRTIPKTSDDCWKENYEEKISLNSSSLGSESILSKNRALNKPQNFLPQNSSMGSLKLRKELLTNYPHKHVLPQIRKLQLESNLFLNCSSITSSSEESSSINSQSTCLGSCMTNQRSINLSNNNQKLRMSRQEWSSLSNSYKDQNLYSKKNKKQFISTPRLVNNNMTLNGINSESDSTKISPLSPVQNSLAYSLYPQSQISISSLEDAPSNFYYKPSTIIPTPYDYKNVNKKKPESHFLFQQVSLYDEILKEKRKILPLKVIEKAPSLFHYYKSPINLQYYNNSILTDASISKEVPENLYLNKSYRQNISLEAMERIPNHCFYNNLNKTQYYQTDLINPSTSSNFLSQKHSIEKIPEELANPAAIYNTNKIIYPKNNISFSRDNISYNSPTDTQNLMVFFQKNNSALIYENENQEYSNPESPLWNSSREFKEEEDENHYYDNSTNYNNQKPSTSPNIERAQKTSLYNCISNYYPNVPLNNIKTNQRRKRQFTQSYSTTS